jgi:DNA-binding response OmpR family regulator
MMKENILIVEDEKDIADLIAHHMKVAGFNVMVAYNGAATFRELENRLPDLILLDLMLPDMDGMEICKILPGLLRKTRNELSSASLRNWNVGILE